MVYSAVPVACMQCMHTVAQYYCVGLYCTVGCSRSHTAGRKPTGDLLSHTKNPLSGSAERNSTTELAAAHNRIKLDFSNSNNCLSLLVLYSLTRGELYIVCIVEPEANPWQYCPFDSTEDIFQVSSDSCG